MASQPGKKLLLEEGSKICLSLRPECQPDPFEDAMFCLVWFCLKPSRSAPDYSRAYYMDNSNRLRCLLLCSTEPFCPFPSACGRPIDKNTAEADNGHEGHLCSRCKEFLNGGTGGNTVRRALGTFSSATTCCCLLCLQAITSDPHTSLADSGSHSCSRLAVAGAPLNLGVATALMHLVTMH